MEPEFKSKEMQEAAVVKSSITELPKSTVLQQEITDQLNRFFAIKDPNAYKQYTLGVLQGNKKQLSGSDLMLVLFSALQTYLTNLNENETKVKLRIERIIHVLRDSTQLLLELSTPEDNKVDIRTDIQALFLGILTKNL